MNHYSYPALITSLKLCLYLWTVLGCGYARRQHRVAAPAVTGHPDFERRFRIQQNTLEQLMLFIPSLWIFSLLVSPVWSVIPGLIFVLGRVMYVVTYVQSGAAPVSQSAQLVHWCCSLAGWGEHSAISSSFPNRS